MRAEVIRWKESEAPARAELEARLEAEGYAPFSWSDSPGTVYGDHHHDEDESLWILSGAMEMSIAGETFVLEAGDRLILPRHTVHRARVCGAEPARYLIGHR